MLVTPLLPAVDRTLRAAKQTTLDHEDPFVLLWDEDRGWNVPHDQLVERAAITPIVQTRL